MLIPRAEINPFCILEKPFDIITDGLFGYVYNPERSLEKHVLRICKISAPKRNLSTWCLLHSVVIFQTKTMEYIPGPVSPQLKFKNKSNNQQQIQTTWNRKWRPRPPARLFAQAGSPGGRQTLRKERNMRQIKVSMGTGIHTIGFVMHMAVMEHQKSSLEMAWRPSCESIITHNFHLRLR